MSVNDLIFEKQSEFLGIKVSKAEKDLIEKYATENNLNMTKVVRLALRSFFAEKEISKNTK